MAKKLLPTQIIEHFPDSDPNPQAHSMANITESYLLDEPERRRLDNLQLNNLEHEVLFNLTLRLINLEPEEIEGFFRSGIDDRVLTVIPVTSATELRQKLISRTPKPLVIPRPKLWLVK